MKNWSSMQRSTALPNILPTPEFATKNFVLRYMTPPMVTERWVSWTSNNFLMGQINSRTTNLNKIDLQRYVATAIKNQRAIFGIFRKSDFEHIGLYDVMVDMRHRIANLDVLVEIPKIDLHTTLSETDPFFLAYLRHKMGFQKAAAQVPATFKDLLKHYEKSGWLKEGILREELPGLKANRRVDAVQFGKLLV